MPSKKGKAKQASASNSPATTTAMYDVIPGPGYKVLGHVTFLSERRKYKTYADAGLCQTSGRVGLSAFLSPDQSTICVVGGDAVRSQQEVTANDWDFNPSSDDEPLFREQSLEPPISVPKEEESRAPTAVLPKEKSKKKSAAGQTVSSPVITSEVAAADVPAALPLVIKPAPVSIPAEFKTDFPLVECFRIHSSSWYIPAGEQRRAAACGGVIRWPTQSGLLVAWQGVPATGAALPSEIPPSRPPLPIPLSSAQETATPTTSRGVKTTSDSPLKDLPRGNPPVEPARPASAPLNQKKWEGPASVFVVGGWDGRRRLSTIFDYNISSMEPSAEDANNSELVLGSIPQVTDLVSLPPLSNATATFVKDRWFVFGGNTVNGCTDDLYLIESSRLREAAEAQSTDNTGENSPWGSSKTKAVAVTNQNASVVWECHPISGADYAAMFALGGGTNVPSRETEGLSEREASTTLSANNSRGSPSNFTVTGPSIMGTLGSGQNSAPPTINNQLPGPPPRSSHSATAFQGRYIVFFGGRQLVLPHPEPPGRGRSKSVQKKPPPPRKGKEKDGKGKGAKGPIVPVDEDEEMLPTLKLLSDVSMYDTEIKGWVQVRVVGSDLPPPRYAAAMCVVPPPLPAHPPTANAFESIQPEVSVASMSFRQRREGNAHGGSGASRELVMHGGFGEQDTILSDLWILQFTGKGQGGSIVEVDASSGIPTAPVRWIRVTPETIPVSPSNSTGAASTAQANSSRNLSPGLPAVDSSVHQGPDSITVDFPPRAQHAIVATSNRDIFILGGVQPYAYAAQNAMPSLQPHASSVAPELHLKPCVTSDKTEVVKITVPTLESVVEVPIHHRKVSVHKKK